MSASETAPLLQWDAGGRVKFIAVSHNGTLLVSGSDDSLVRIWDMRTGSLVLGPLSGHNGAVPSVAWSHDDARIVSSSYDGTICMWDAHTGNPIGEPLRGHTGEVFSAAFSPDSTQIISGSNDETIRMWDACTGAPIGQPLRKHTGAVYSVAFSPDSTRIASGSDDSLIGIWDSRTGDPICEPLRGHSSAVLSVAFSPDSSRIVSSSWDSTIRVWDARNGALIGQPFLGHINSVGSAVFSPDSARIVSGSYDMTVCIWDASTGAALEQPLRKHTHWVRSVAFSPDSTYIVSGSSDKTICLWEAPGNTPSFDMVTSSMSAQEMFEVLVKHGCSDLSLSVDPSRHSASAIASGGFGDVWQAWLKNGVIVAVKCLRLHIILEGDVKGMKRMTRELYHWSKARHENIQELLGVVVFQDRLGMVSLWMANGNLQQYIARNPSVERYPLCVQVAKGIAYLHGIGMIHGDLKAVNVLVSADGVAKISDFDYSRLSESTLRFSETTKTGGGTVRWMAPELLLHQEDDGPPVALNTATDVYALGMTMLEIISDKVPYHQYQFDVGIFHALVKKQPPKRPQELSGSDYQSTAMWALLLQCWDHDPPTRPDAPSVLASLQSFAS